MSTHIAPFTNLSHIAQPYGESGGTKLSKVQITRRYSGDAIGESSSELLLCQTPNGIMAYAGTDCFVGTLKGRAGSFVYQHAGIFEGGKFNGIGYIVPDSGTGELARLRGTARVEVGAANAHALHITEEA
ncbi:MAG TPA: DUF3224 domain-containing protein [Opitutaceae bacterium]